MKAVVEQYGRFLIVAIIAGIVSLFVFSENGLRSKLGELKPQATVKNENNSEQLKEWADRSMPVLDVKTEKLKVGTTYRLLDFVVISEDADGTELPVVIKQIISPDGAAIPVKDTFVPEKKGVYKVTYENKDFVPLVTTKTYRFIAN